ncbi:hypothetical protein BC332_07854 [Capsicum chinense]|nr:hypothetical protein BC332_07854 [Capsicum chinense]
MPLIQIALEESGPSINSDLNSKLHQVFKVCPLVLSYSLSKKLFGDYLVRYGYILWFEKQKEGSMLEVALDNEAFEEFFWVVNTDKEEHNNIMVFVQLFSNLEDKKYEISRGKSLKNEEFHGMLREIIFDTKVTGTGAKDILLYLFGVPVTALFIKQSVIPQAMPNEIFIPGVTSATVFLLAKLHMI